MNLTPIITLLLILDALWNVNPRVNTPRMGELAAAYRNNEIVSNTFIAQREFVLWPWAPFGWRGATNTKDCDHMYLNEAFRNSPLLPDTIAHELGHIYTRCTPVQNDEAMAELMGLEVLSSLGYEQEVIYALRWAAMGTVGEETLRYLRISDLDRLALQELYKNPKQELIKEVYFIPVLNHVIKGETKWTGNRFTFETDDLYSLAKKHNFIVEGN